MPVAGRGFVPQGKRRRRARGRVCRGSRRKEGWPSGWQTCRAASGRGRRHRRSRRSSGRVPCTRASCRGSRRPPGAAGACGRRAGGAGRRVGRAVIRVGREGRGGVVRVCVHAGRGGGRARDCKLSRWTAWFEFIGNINIQSGDFWPGPSSARARRPTGRRGRQVVRVGRKRGRVRLAGAEAEVGRRELGAGVVCSLVRPSSITRPGVFTAGAVWGRVVVVVRRTTKISHSGCEEVTSSRQCLVSMWESRRCPGRVSCGTGRCLRARVCFVGSSQ